MSGVLYVAEMGSQHKGNAALACRYAHEFKQAGASILKMQFGWPTGDPIRAVNETLARAVARYCERIGLELMASLFSLKGLELARAVGMQRYKIAHQREEDYALIEAALADGKETFIASTVRGWASPDDRLVRNIFTTEPYPSYDVCLPTFGGEWHGYSDHTIGNGACLLAVARGARYIEKHVALDVTDLWTKDTSFSATPAQFAELVRLGREIEQVRDAAV